MNNHKKIVGIILTFALTASACRQEATPFKLKPRGTEISNQEVEEVYEDDDLYAEEDAEPTPFSPSTGSNNTSSSAKIVVPENSISRKQLNFNLGNSADMFYVKPRMKASSSIPRDIPEALYIGFERPIERDPQNGSLLVKDPGNLTAQTNFATSRNSYYIDDKAVIRERNWAIFIQPTIGLYADRWLTSAESSQYKNSRGMSSLTETNERTIKGVMISSMLRADYCDTKNSDGILSSASCDPNQKIRSNIGVEVLTGLQSSSTKKELKDSNTELVASFLSSREHPIGQVTRSYDFLATSGNRASKPTEDYGIVQRNKGTNVLNGGLVLSNKNTNNADGTPSESNHAGAPAGSLKMPVIDKLDACTLKLDGTLFLVRNQGLCYCNFPSSSTTGNWVKASDGTTICSTP